MQFNNLRRESTVGVVRWRGIPAGILALLLAGCAGMVPSDEKLVEQRANERWEAIVAGDLKTAYEFISPAGRSALTYDAFEKGVKRGFHKAARVKEVRCTSNELCEVTLEVEYEFRGRRTKTSLWEKWIRQGRDWWYLYQR